MVMEEKTWMFMVVEDKMIVVVSEGEGDREEGNERRSTIDDRPSLVHFRSCEQDVLGSLVRFTNA